jgi:type II secretory pathway pseudopilin PulG
MESVKAALRDPRYIVPLAVLICVIGVSAALGRSASNAAGEPVASTPTAEATAAPTATPLGPSQEDAALDARRRSDLAAIAVALDAYRTRNGSYPSTQNDFATLCAQAFDAGCLLTTVTKQLPANDRTYPYWYQSDGTTYTLFSRLQTAVADSDCPAQTPPALANMPTVCLSGGSR